MPNQVGSSILERTLKGLVPRLYEATSGRRESAELLLQPELDEDDLEKLKNWIDSCLSLQGEEVAARTRAAVLGRSYLQLNQQGRRRFFKLLAENYAVDDEVVKQRFQRWNTVDHEQRALAGNSLRDALEPPYMALLTQFTELKDGVKFLVDMRAELLGEIKTEPSLIVLEQDLKRLLTSWFDIGLLQLEPIDWRSSAELLEKLIAYEAVHAVQSWSDLKNRLGDSRRCFALFHPNMPGEPLIFVTVALVEGLADNVHTLLDEQAPQGNIKKADTAIFYSISNAQHGLAGISFGNFLIKRVVAQLQLELPGLKRFATLSPIPGFLRWLDNRSHQDLENIPGGKEWLSISEPQLAEGWELDKSVQQKIQKPLTQLAAYYLCHEKAKGASSSERAKGASSTGKADGSTCTEKAKGSICSEKAISTNAVNPVAHFHLSNGAQVQQLNWMADPSSKGLKQSAGLMVNYYYELGKIEERSQSYRSLGTISVTSKIKKLIKTD